MKKPNFRHLAVCAAVILVAACGTNPITGKTEFSLYGTQAQIQMGLQQYAPSQQAQGGQYYLDPSLQTYVSRVGAKLVAANKQVFPEAVDLPYEFVVLNNAVPNAWALPGGKIAINRGLLTELSDESELAAVLSHEIIHAAAGHGAAQMTRGTALGLGSALLGQVAKESKYEAYIKQGLQLGGAAGMAKYGRDDELESDYYGIQLMVEAGYSPQGAVRLQQTFVKMSGGKGSDGLSAFFASHPPSQERVDKNKALAAQIGKGGITGKSRYQNATAQLTKDKKAYVAESRSSAAMQAKNWDAVIKESTAALKYQPNEAGFWLQRGIAYQQQGNTAKAEKDFSRAIQLNPSYFKPWLARGVLNVEQGQTEAGRTDLLRSQKILPTEIAQKYLSLITVQ